MERIEEMLETFIDEVRTGKREGSVVTNHTTGSLSADQKEAWRQLRKELESVGITPTLFSKHHDRVIERLLRAIDDGDLVEDIEKELSDTTRKSFDEHFTTADPMYKTMPEVDTMTTTTSPGDLPTTQSIKGPSRITKLLFRVMTR